MFGRGAVICKERSRVNVERDGRVLYVVEGTLERVLRDVTRVGEAFRGGRVMAGSSRDGLWLMKACAGGVGL